MGEEEAHTQQNIEFLIIIIYLMSSFILFWVVVGASTSSSDCLRACLLQLSSIMLRVLVALQLLVGFPVNGFIRGHRRIPRFSKCRQWLTATAEEAYTVTLPKPLGVTIEKLPGATRTTGEGVVAVVAVRGNAESEGIQPGDALVGMQSIFGDAIWPVPTEADAVERIEEHIANIDGDVTLQLLKGGAQGVCEENLDLECDVFFDGGSAATGKSDSEMKDLWGSIYEDDYFIGDATIGSPDDDFANDPVDIFAGEADREAVFGDGALADSTQGGGGETEEKPKKKGWFG